MNNKNAVFSNWSKSRKKQNFCHNFGPRIAIIALIWLVTLSDNLNGAAHFEVARLTPKNCSFASFLSIKKYLPRPSCLTWPPSSSCIWMRAQGEEAATAGLKEKARTGTDVRQEVGVLLAVMPEAVTTEGKEISQDCWGDKIFSSQATKNSIHTFIKKVKGWLASFWTFQSFLGCL